MFVCSIIVDYEMEIKTRRCFIVYLFEEANKFLVSVARHEIAYDFPSSMLKAATRVVIQP